MKKITKTGILLILLVVPVLIFLFLKNFGQNHFTLPRYIPLMDSTTGNVKFEKVIYKGEEINDTVFHSIPNFNLTDQNGKPQNSNLFKNKIHIAEFIFTRCPGQCPIMSKEMQRVQESFENEKDVIILSYSVDPEFDTPENLKIYANNLGAIDGKWYFLTGQKKEIYRMAYYGYFVTAKEENKNLTNLEDRFVHTDKCILVDSEGHIRGFYNGTDRKDIDKLVLETKVLLHELKQERK